MKSNIWLKYFIALLGATILIFIYTLGDKAVHLFHDDSFFYAVIARNYAEGLGFTFDGIAQTNGFHLLWVLLLSALHKFVPLYEISGVFAIAAIYIVLMLLAAMSYAQVIFKESRSHINAAIFSICFIFVSGLSDFGQESALYSFLFSIMVYLLWPHINPSIETKENLFKSLGIALVIIAIVLTRLDSVVILGFISFYLAYNKKFKLFSIVSVCLAVALTGVVIWNYSNFGHYATISSYLKSGFELRKINQIARLGVSVRMIFSLGLLVLAAYFSKRNHAWLKQFLIFIISGYVFYFALLLSYVEAVGSWYVNVPFGFSIFLFFYAMPLTTERDARILSWSTKCLVAGALILLGGSLFFRKALFDNYRFSPIEVGRYIRDNLQNNDSDIFFQVDGSGVVSYFAQAKIINGDGLVNNFEYQEFIRNNKFRDYVSRKGVHYLVTGMPILDRGNIIETIPLWRDGDRMQIFEASAHKSLYQTTSSGSTYRVFEIDKVNLVCNH